MTSHPVAGTVAECEVCGGPCREPFRLPAIHDSYPFLSREVIVATQPQPEPEPEPVQGRRRGDAARARHLAEDRARHLQEDRS